jgi:aminoglycoside phosphotransferase (APT) family kinase protein
MMQTFSDATGSPSMSDSPPPAQGVRLDWQDIPAQVRAAVEQALGGAVVNVTSQPSGFSPGVAVRLQLENGRRVFVKAVGPEPNPDSPEFHRREARNMQAMPTSAPVPRLLWSLDELGWVVLVFEDVEGKHPANPWRNDELSRVLDAMTDLSNAMTPSPLQPPVVSKAADAFMSYLQGWWRLKTFEGDGFDRLDAWSQRHIDGLVELESQAVTAAEGDTLLHFDIRADNMLLTPEKVWFVDWPHARIGAAWIDLILFAPSVRMQGGPPPEELLARYSLARNADRAAVTAVIVAMAGFFIRQSLQPPPPGLPTLRAFQAAQGAAACEWIATRTGWQ